MNKKQLIAHIDEDDKNFNRVIEIMRNALEDDAILKKKLKEGGL